MYGYISGMTNDAQLPLDRQIAARRNTAVRKYEFARALQRHAETLRRDAEREMQEIDIAEKVLRELPETHSELMALEHSVSPERLWNEAQSAAMSEMAARNEAAHSSMSSKIKDIIVHFCEQLLSDGTSKSTEELWQALQERGVPLRVQNPVQRVSQILSADERFRNQRGRGWYLAALERPDEWSERLERRSRELVQKDNSAT